MFPRAIAHSSERLIAKLGNREILGIHFTFRNKNIYALNNERLTSRAVFGGPVTTQPQVLTLGYFFLIEAIPLVLEKNEI